MNQQQQNYRLTTDSSGSHCGIKCVLPAPNDHHFKTKQRTLSSRDISMLTLVLSHSLNSLQKFLTFEHNKTKAVFFCLFLTVRVYSTVTLIKIIQEGSCNQNRIVYLLLEISKFSFMPFFGTKKARFSFIFIYVTYFSLPLVLWYIIIHIYKNMVEHFTTFFGLHKLFNYDITCHIYFVLKDKNAVIINLGYP